MESGTDRAATRLDLFFLSPHSSLEGPICSVWTVAPTIRKPCSYWFHVSKDHSGNPALSMDEHLGSSFCLSVYQLVRTTPWETVQSADAPTKTRKDLPFLLLHCNTPCPLTSRYLCWPQTPNPKLLYLLCCFFTQHSNPSGKNIMCQPVTEGRFEICDARFESSYGTLSFPFEFNFNFCCFVLLLYTIHPTFQSC